MAQANNHIRVIKRLQQASHSKGSDKNLRNGSKNNTTTPTVRIPISALAASFVQAQFSAPVATASSSNHPQGHNDDTTVDEIVDSAIRNFQSFALEDPPLQVNCDLCTGVFRSQEDLQLHIPVHRPPLSTRRCRPFRCKACGKRFQHESDRDWHFLSHGPKPFNCPVPMCKALFTNEKERFDHYQKEHPGGVFYRCEDCNLNFPCCCGLHAHSVKTHSSPYMCRHCGVCNKSRTLYEEHLGDHMDLVPLRRTRGLFQLMTLVSPQTLQILLESPTQAPPSEPSTIPSTDPSVCTLPAVGPPIVTDNSHSSLARCGNASHAFVEPPVPGVSPDVAQKGKPDVPVICID